LPAPPTGWTLGNYANLALAMQMAINALPDALSVTITNDDSNLQLRLITSIPNVFSSPNPPTVTSLTPNGVQTGSYLSNITVLTPIGGASSQNISWTFSQPFNGALSTLTTNTLESSIGINDYFSASIPSTTPTFTALTSTLATGWTPSLVGNQLYVSHAGDIGSSFPSGTVIAFSRQDYSGLVLTNRSFVSGSTHFATSQNNGVLRNDVTSTAQAYTVTNPLISILPNEENRLYWQNPTGSIPNLSYNNGFFTNIGTKRLRFSFNVTAYYYVSFFNGSGTNNALAFNLWYTINREVNRRGETAYLYPDTTGYFCQVLTSSWTFSLEPNDLVAVYTSCDKPYFQNSGYFLFTAPAALIDVIEV
jgi:hypothetical protein